MRRVEVAQEVTREYAIKFEKFVNIIGRLWAHETPAKKPNNNNDEIQDLCVKIAQKHLSQDGFVAVRSGEGNPADLLLLNTATNELALIKVINHSDAPSADEIRELYDLKECIEGYNSCGFGKIKLFSVSVILHRSGAPSLSYKQV